MTARKALLTIVLSLLATSALAATVPANIALPHSVVGQNGGDGVYTSQDVNVSGSAYTIQGSSGGTAGTDISSFPATIETFLVAGGATQTGTPYNLPSGRVTVQATANADAAAAFACVASVMVSNDYVAWNTAGTLTLSDTGATADSATLAMDAAHAYIRVDVSGFSGTGATCTVTLGI